MKTRKWLKLAGAVVAIAALGAWGYYEAMKRAWIRYNEYDIRSEGSLTVGDLAPDLELAKTDGSGTQKISELYREKPLVLVFGSYT
jgi:hypothetical protein